MAVPRGCGKGNVDALKAVSRPVSGGAWRGEACAGARGFAREASGATPERVHMST